MRDPSAPVPPPLTTTLNWRRPSPEEDERKARSYVPIIERVLRESAALPEILVHVAIGAACPAVTAHDKAIWIYVCRQYDAFIDAKPEQRVAALRRNEALLYEGASR
ncbi:MAG TPA: hypothetical protein VHZ74_10585 [Bryobacteraceae bacterium]|jgi:hypothetical protein|nr:hypothetical protein [Bryobacteraceae bacterium]